MTFIFAGDYEQAVNYCRKHGIPRSEFKYISSPEVLRGYDLSKHKIIFTATYRERTLEEENIIIRQCMRWGTQPEIVTE